MIAIYVERIHRRIGVLRRVPAIDPEALDVRGRFWQRPVLAFADLGICGERKFGHRESSLSSPSVCHAIAAGYRHPRESGGNPIPVKIENLRSLLGVVLFLLHTSI